MERLALSFLYLLVSFLLVESSPSSSITRGSGVRFPWRVARGGSSSSSAAAATRNILPPDEVELNNLAHAKEIDDNTKDGDYFHGPCGATLPELQTKGYSVVDGYALPDFDDEFRKSQGNNWIQVTSKPLLTKEECSDIISLAEKYFQHENDNSEWSTLPSGRFEIAGSWIKDIPPVRDCFNKLLQTKLFPALAQLFPDVVGDASNIRIQSAYLFKYTPESGEKTDMHMDSSLLSFTMLLNDPADFDGGGTFFECLGSENGEIVEMNQGDVTLRPAGVRHRGQPITAGTRYVIGGFCTLVNKCEHTRQLLTRGTAALANGETATAQRLFQLARDCGDSKFSEIHMSVAHTIRKFGDNEGALASYQTAYDVNPRSADAAFMVGVMHGELGNDETAMEWYRKAALLNEYDGDAYYRQGLILGRRDDYTGERAMYEQAIRVQPNHADSHCNLGVIFGEEGNAEEEIACYERALAVEPENAEAINNAKAAYYHRGVGCYQAGDLDGAIASFERLVNRLAPEEPMITQMYEAMLQRKEAALAAAGSQV